ncbi:MAG: terminase large subunit [Pseudomonadales bacterium]|nr:terminase large subunit [Pseudomonadales bacterium]
MIFACPDWQARLSRHELPLDWAAVYPVLNQKRANHVVSLLEKMRIPDLPEKPTLKGNVGQWFFQVAKLAAGGLQPDGTQLVKSLLVVVPKKNSKTSGGAALMLALMLMNPRPNAEFLLVGPTQAITEIAFRQASGIIQADPGLAQRFHIREHLKRIEHKPSGAFLSIKSFDERIITGTKASVILLDECHLLNSDRASRIIGQLKGAGAAIKESQLLMITTMSDTPASGWWKSELNKARQIRDGESDIEHYVPLIWEPAPEERKNLSLLCQPDVFKRTNPNLGHSVSMGWIKTSLKEALNSGEDETRRFLSQHCNAEFSQFTTNAANWAGAEHWHKYSRSHQDLEWILRECPQISIGFDGGGSDDLSAVSVLGVKSAHWHVWCRCWVEPVALGRRKSISSLLNDFAEQGDLIIAPTGEEVAFLVELAGRVEALGTLKGVGVDPAGIAGEIAELVKDDFSLADKVISVPQGFKLRPGWLAIERNLKRGRLTHAGQPIMDWCVSNCKMAESGLITKKVSGVGKIDPAVALASAAMVHLNQPEPFGGDVSWMIG